jgi:hypothetical protein
MALTHIRPAFQLLGTVKLREVEGGCSHPVGTSGTLVATFRSVYTAGLVSKGEYMMRRGLTTHQMVNGQLFVTVNTRPCPSLAKSREIPESATL